MKRILVVAALMLGFAAAASAQPKAVGVRATWGTYEISYQHTLGTNFAEADLGFWGDGFGVTGTYNWNIFQFGDAFNVYAGPGATIALGKYVFNLGIVGQVGLEYDFRTTFSIPLQLSLDIRPWFGLGGGGFDYGGFYPSLGIRYEF